MGLPGLFQARDGKAQGCFLTVTEQSPVWAARAGKDAIEVEFARGDTGAFQSDLELTAASLPPSCLFGACGPGPVSLPLHAP